MSDRAVLNMIRSGYQTDEFCKHVVTMSMKGWTESNGLWYIRDCLLIPWVATIQETLFKLAHDTLGHFGAGKSYGSFHDTYYWPNMHKDLEQAHIPACQDYLHNKSHMTRPPRPLHPLPVPDQRGQSIAMDFMGPLPLDNNFYCLLTITDQLRADICIVPTKTDLTAKELAVVFFWQLVLWKWFTNKHCLQPWQRIHLTLLESSDQTYWSNPENV